MTLPQAQILASVHAFDYSKMFSGQIRYLVDYRLQKAMEELTSPDKKPIGEIAFSCGFTDATYFNRCFKKEYGMTPTEYISCLKKE